MNNTKKPMDYIKELFILAMPIIMGNLGIVFIGAGDVYVAGKYSTQALAATGISNSIISIVIMFGVGLLVSISPVISNLRGSRKASKKYFVPTIKFAMQVAFITSIIILMCAFLFEHIGIEKSLIPEIKIYTIVMAFSVFGGNLHLALKEFLQGFEIVVFANFVTILGIFLNLLLNFVFAFGFYIIPSMGIMGLALASVGTRTFMGLALLIYCLCKFKFKNYEDKKYAKSLIKVGLPISSAMLIEFLAFNLITIFMARISGLYAAAQNITVIWANIAFMVPLAISNAMSVKIGYLNGLNDKVELQKYAKWGTIISVLFMSVCAVIFWKFPHQLTSVFTKDVEVIKIAVPVIILFAFFEIFDGLQVSFGGIFKGIKKTNITMFANLIGYGSGIVMGYILGIKCNMQLKGFWIGLLIGSVIINLILGITYKKMYSKI